MYGHASCNEARMRAAGMVLLLLIVPSALADTANVAKASELLDFDIGRTPAVKEGGLAALDIDGDGQVSKAEAAGNEQVTGGFDRADRDRNGKVSAAEWERYEKWQERRAKAREARLARAKAKASASAGGTAAKKPRGSAP
jgi:hypothetical protein